MLSEIRKRFIWFSYFNEKITPSHILTGLKKYRSFLFEYFAYNKITQFRESLGYFPDQKEFVKLKILKRNKRYLLKGFSYLSDDELLIFRQPDELKQIYNELIDLSLEKINKSLLNDIEIMDLSFSFYFKKLNFFNHRLLDKIKYLPLHKEDSKYIVAYKLKETEDYKLFIDYYNYPSFPIYKVVDEKITKTILLQDFATSSIKDKITTCEVKAQIHDSIKKIMLKMDKSKFVL